MRLRNAILFVKDMERMKRFYGEMLGVGPGVVDASSAFVSFETGGAWLSLHAIPPEIAEGIEIESPAVAREESAVKLVFEVADLERERGRIVSLGGRIVERAWLGAGGFDAVDPEGNVFQVCLG